MEEKLKIFESLLERATEYGKTSYELVKLKTVDKTSDIVSSFIPQSIVFILIASFMLFANFGLALWLGEIFGKVYFGFFVVAVFYAFIAIVLRVFLHKWIRKIVRNHIIKLMLK